ncbi:TPA: conjugal transfer protein TraH [Legionella bozemanae]|uniref:TraH protein n=2 Tax=Legionellaceae TaxID=444 RepID=A8QYR4_9GAMM|nr:MULTISPECIES: conjugal transfer protein TraH [Legionellaceae]KTC70050.1 TraH pilus assembly protein [Legionella bozemanae]MCW8485159.1 conjugal transfer protein TraH [Fluoribacter dumoffii]BAF92652.1 TraH protein [Fluoribacter dumoffii Tex-KL]STP13934.1 conjugal transfer pilus assembly protein TraH [Legionella bozemanae]
MKKVFLTLCLFGFFSTVEANVSTDLDNFFNGMGYASNVTSPAAFESQAAGFFGGGSLYARNQVRQYQLVQLDLPSYRAGCGGIDLFTGSMSFLSEQKLVDLGKSVMTNAGVYAVDVMLASTVPELKQVRDYLQQLEQMANQASINSCQLSQNMVGGIWPKTAESQQKICKDQAAMGKEGLFSDYVKARMACSGNGFDNVMNKASQDETRKKQVVLNKNLVWSLLQSKSFLNSDRELAEMVMSLTGTLIIDKEGKVTNVPSLASNADLINALVGTGNGVRTAKIWRCKDVTAGNQCMQVSLQDITIAENSTLTSKVREIIRTINTKLAKDEKPTSREINFLSMTSLPVMKFLSVLNSTQYSSAAVDIEEYATLIAHDLLTHYLTELLAEVSNATAGSELNSDLVNDIQKRIHTATSKVTALDPKVGRKLKEKLSLIEHMARIEKQVASTMNSTVS